MVRKKVKNLNMTIQPPDGRVRVSIPRHVPDETVHKFVLSKLRWIKEKQAELRALPKPALKEFISGEQHYLWGEPYLLDVIERWGRHEVLLSDNAHLCLYVMPNTTRANREKVLKAFYRTEMEKRLPVLVAKWESVMGVQVSEWRIKQMKTRWGSCNVKARRVWVNLELARRPPQYLEYILVHEMVHLLERGHNKRFYRFMNKLMPKWPSYEELLERSPWGVARREY